MKNRNKLHHCVWIELERHESNGANEIAAFRATKMLRRLGIEHNSFHWSVPCQQYQYLMGENGNGGYYDLPEDGHMFNLDYLAGQGGSHEQ